MSQIIQTAALAFVLIVSAGCENWQSIPKDYVCTAEQMDKAQRETAWCTEHGGYLKSYCYSAAITRNCERKKP